MKVKIENLKNYKKLVSSLDKFVSKKTANPNEQCIKFAASDDKISLTALENSSHKVTLSFPATVLEEGSGFIRAEKLSRMTSALPNNQDMVEIYVTTKGELAYCLNGLGTIVEPLYHNQTAFSGILFQENQDIYLAAEGEENSALLIKAANQAVVSCFGNTNVWLQLKEETASIYTQFAESGFIQYTTPVTSNQEFNIYIKPELLKVFAYLGDSLQIAGGNAPKTIAVNSDWGKATLLGTGVKSGEYEAIDWIVSQPVLSAVTVELSKLEQAIQWQSYGAGVGDSLALSVQSDRLEILGSKLSQSAKLNCIEGYEFSPITLPLQAMLNAIKAVKFKYELLKISQYELSIGNRSVKAISLQPDEEVEISCLAILYEQITRH